MNIKNSVAGNVLYQPVNIRVVCNVAASLPDNSQLPAWSVVLLEQDGLKASFRALHAAMSPAAPAPMMITFCSLSTLLSLSSIYFSYTDIHPIFSPASRKYHRHFSFLAYHTINALMTLSGATRESAKMPYLLAHINDRHLPLL